MNWYKKKYKLYWFLCPYCKKVTPDITIPGKCLYCKNELGKKDIDIIQYIKRGK